ncbi:MAG: cysteine desulfurase NifS [Planctomycetota bacterium]|nr:MAG: cysteine desulfurase NifS [Planctomycetota bacterium]
MTWIYLDNNATTMIDPKVLEAMLPLLGEQYANPSSVHQFGQQARHIIETAREQIADAIGAKTRQIIFTSGGTEANNLAIRGTLAARPDKRHIVTTAVEHESVINLAGQLENEGYRVTCLGVDGQGRLDPAEFETAITEDTALTSIMHANNETGVVFDIERLGRIATDKGVPLHVDAVQTVGKLPIDVSKLPVQLMTMSAHKFHGPKGIGALYVAKDSRVKPQFVGGHQERKLRPGTESTAGIVGMGTALRLAVEHLDEENTRVKAQRDRLETGILQHIPIARVIGHQIARTPNTTDIGFEALEAEAILMLLSNYEVCASSGSACSSGSLEPSHVLRAMKIDERIAHGAIRFSLSRFTTNQEIDRTLEIMPKVIERLQKLQPRNVKTI